MGISFNMKKGEQHSLGQTCQTNESLWSQEIHRPHSRASSLGNQRGVTGKRILHPTENFRGTQPWYGPTTNHKISTTWILMFGTKVTWMETTQTNKSCQRKEIPLAWLLLNLQCIRKKSMLRILTCHKSTFLYSTLKNYYFPYLCILSSPPQPSQGILNIWRRQSFHQPFIFIPGSKIPAVSIWIPASYLQQGNPLT